MKIITFTLMFVVAALAGVGCTSQPNAAQGTGFGGSSPPEEPVPTGPLHVIFEGIYDAYVPVNATDTYVHYSPSVDPPVASFYVNVPSASPVHVGISGTYRPTAGSEVAVLDDFIGLSASFEGDPSAFVDATVRFSPNGIQLDGIAVIKGVARTISLDGPIYRACERTGPPPGWTPPSSDPDVGGSWEGGVQPPSAWYDPDFASPDCDPFR